MRRRYRCVRAALFMLVLCMGVALGPQEAACVDCPVGLCRTSAMCDGCVCDGIDETGFGRCGL